MFEEISKYSGQIVGASGEESESAHNPSMHEPQSTEEILLQAKQEAELVLQQAREEAIEERNAILEDASIRADEMISNHVTQACVDLRLDLWSSKSALGDVLAQSLDAIMGDIGNERATLLAVQKAIGEHCETRQATILINLKASERLHLVALASGKKLTEFGINIKIDPSLSDERCILDTGFSRVEVGVISQINALKKVFAENKKKAQREPDNGRKPNGSLM